MGKLRSLGFTLLVASALSATLAGLAAAQCMVCDPSLLCVSFSSGAQWCYGNGKYCALALPCVSIPGGGGCDFRAHGGQVAMRMTLVAIGGKRSPNSSGRANFVVPGSGQDRSCRHVMGALSRLGLGSAGALSLEDGSHLFAAGPGAVAFQTASGSGYSVRIDCSGATPHLSIGSVEGGREARILTRGRIASNELLVARLEIDGKPYALAIQSEWLDAKAPDLGTRVRAMQQDLHRELDTSAPAQSLGLKMTELRD